MSFKNIRVLNAVGIIAFIVLCWLPSFGPGTNSWQIRLTCILLLLPLVTALVYFSFLNFAAPQAPDSAGAKFVEAVKKACFRFFKVKESQESEKAPPKYVQALNKIWRVGVVIATLLFTVGITLPFEWSGLKALRGGTLESISTQVTDNNLTFGTWFLAQGISVGSKTNQRDLYYFLGSGPIRIEHQYNFLLLPGYPIILQHTNIDEK